MNIFISTTCWANKFPKIRDCILNLVKLEFKNIELGSGHKFEFDALKSVKEVQQEYNLNFSIHAPFPPPKHQFILNPASLHPPTLKKTNQCIKKSIEAANELNATIVGIHPGFIAYPTLSLDKTKPKHFVNYNDAFSTAVSSFEEYCDYASSYNIKILIENLDFYHEGYMFVKEEEFLNVFKTIKAKNLGFLLDLGHLNYTAHKLHKLNLNYPLNFIKKLKNFTQMVHIHDNDGLYDQHLPPGDGNIEFEKYLKIFREKLDTLPLVLEMYQDIKIEEIKRARKNLYKILGEVR